MTRALKRWAVGLVAVLSSCAPLAPAGANDLPDLGGGPVWVSASRYAWTREQTAAGLLALTAHAIDWGQTRTIARHPDRFYETNRILGRHPSVGQVDAYFVGTALLIGLAAHALPEWRVAGLGAYASFEFAVAARNARLGIRVSF